MSQDRTNRRKWLILAAKVLIVLIVAWGIRATLESAFTRLAQQWDEGRFHLQPHWLAVSGGLYLAGLLPCALFWRRTLSAVGQETNWGSVLRAYYIGHLGKYVPGKAMVVVLRTGLIRGAGASTGLIAVTVLYETLTMMAVGGFLAAAVLAFWFRDQWPLALLAVGLMLIAGLPTVPPIFRRLAQLAGVGRADPDATEKLERLGYRSLAFGWVTIGCGWLLMGLSLWATLRAIGIVEQYVAWQLPLYTAAVALATVAGFLSLIPGGALVREAVLLQLLVHLPNVDAPAALVAVVLLRLVWLVAELLISGILYFALKPRAVRERVG